MRPDVLHQRDARPSASAEAGAEPGDEFEPRRAAADHDNLVQALCNGPIRARRSRNCRVVLNLRLQQVCHQAYSG